MNQVGNINKQINNLKKEINSYYLYPWVIQVVDSIYKYIDR